MNKPNRTLESYNLDVVPSDLSQSIFRVALVTCVVIWSAVDAADSTVHTIYEAPNFKFAILYWTISVAIYLWTAVVLARAAQESELFRLTRVVSIFTDVGAAAFYTAISGEAGIILYPVFLTISIGYGYRFGVRYLYLALIVSGVFFSVSAQYNEYIAENRILVWAYYLGIALVPLYSAILLNRHREVLERIREVNLARSRFIANMSHELRTPLHAIISVSDLLSESYSSGKDGNQENFQKIRMVSDSALHLLNLVNRVLDIAAADAGGTGAVEKMPVALQRPLLEAVRICAPNAEKKALSQFWFYDTDLPEFVLTSSDHIQEIVINTLGNAIKYTHAGHVRAHFGYQRSGGGEHLVITISDTGIGISPKLLPTIFEPFTLGDDSTARQYLGTGLGLTLTKNFVENLRGTIEFRSAEGMGTDCIITLPLETERGGPTNVDARSEKSTQTIRCGFVSRRSLVEAEYEAMSAAGWFVEYLSPDDASPDLTNGVDAIIVDCDLGRTKTGQVLQAFGSGNRPVTLIALDASPGGTNSRGFLEFNTRLEALRPEDLRRLASIVSWFRDAEDVAEFETATVDDCSGKTVLVADDNPTNLTTARLALESGGAKVVTADSGDSALNELEKSAYDIAFIDLHMPGMSGIEVAQIYQYLFGEPRTPIVILTADATEAAREEALSAGAEAVLTKPLRVSELRLAVASYARSDGVQPAAQGTYTVVDEDSAELLIDRAVIREFLDLGVSETELSSMLDDFFEDSTSLVSNLRTALREHDLIRAREILHSLKGACATVGARELAERIEKLSVQLKKDVQVSDEDSSEYLLDLLISSNAELRKAIAS